MKIKTSATKVFIFNIIVVILLLLEGAGYFDPFFPLTINNIVIVALILAAILLGIKSRAYYAISLAFLLLSAFFLVVGVPIWAERASIYMFQSFMIGVLFDAFGR